MPRLRILVADDNPELLMELTFLLGVEFEVIATATDGKSALELIRRDKPDVAVLDLAMPMLNGIQVTEHLAKDGPPVVICSVETDPEIVEASRRAGALAYVFKSRIEKDLIATVRSVAAINRLPKQTNNSILEIALETPIHESHKQSL
jgi:two-component system response regulator DesR